ncbi:peptidoglycan DD-metalloendopeptidase family protein [Methylobacterium sp. Gmos1]
MRFPLSFVPTQSWHVAPLKFGANRNGGKRKHAGCDLYAPIGTPIYAVADGIVKGFASFYLGTYALTIDHGQFWVRYGEISKTIASKFPIGAQVHEGDQIGEIGDLIGLSLSMLHFEMYDGTAAGPLTVPSNTPYMRRSDLIDPTGYLDAWAGAAGPGANLSHIASYPTLQLGSQGDAVLAWQIRLHNQGYAVSLDAQYGPVTQDATRQFQQDDGFQVADGVVGPETYRAMTEWEKY